MTEQEIKSTLYDVIEKRQAIAVQVDQLRQADANLASEQVKLGIKLDEARALAAIAATEAKENQN